MVTPLTPVITEHWDRPDLYTLDGYRAVGGYQALDKALGSDPDDIITTCLLYTSPSPRDRG